MKRFLALALFPAAATLLVTAIALWSRSAHSIEAGERYAVEANALVLLTPSVLLYLLALPVIWRRVARVPARTVDLARAQAR
ncbi:hypothetical protein [Gemmatimonas sp.]|uniref:hypothetical protein n=1 Tax=Gemmatimonas sp. TaxID=1962908 RepID=UPI00286AC93B|nr:hypothetical protein [Gemmatimonas sp.]